MEALQSTLADLTAAKLTAYDPPPAPGVPLVTPSTDPAVYAAADSSYLKLLNEQSFQKYAVDKPNAATAARFDFAAHTWENNGKKDPIPAWPQYVYLDQNAFDQWWAQLNANLGAGAPPLFFVKPLPAPPPVHILDPVAPAPPPATDGPVGTPVPNNPGVYTAAGGDAFPDGFVYAGATGVYQKHIYTNPFTVNQTRVIWIRLA